MTDLNELLTEVTQKPSIEAERREQFRQANASQALEGLIIDADDLAIQASIINGNMTPDEAVAVYLTKARRAH